MTKAMNNYGPYPFPEKQLIRKGIILAGEGRHTALHFYVAG